MSSPVVVATPSTRLKRLAELMLEHDIGAIPILDATQALVGLVSEADLLSLQSVEDPRRAIAPAAAPRSVPRVASQVMSTEVATVLPDDDITTVARLMRSMRLKHLPVLDGAQTVGIISRRDILKVLARSDAVIRADLQRILDQQALILGAYRAQVSEGVVVLSGPDEPMGRSLSSLLARSVPGVVGVRFADAA